MAIVTPFVQVGTYPTRNFATLGPLQLRPPFTGASIHSFYLRITTSINLPAPGRRHTLYFLFQSLQSAMFLLNSRSHQFYATTSCSIREELHNNVAYLLPKLRYHFAQFLHPSSLKRLGILYLSTSVGLGYGLVIINDQQLFLEAWYQHLMKTMSSPHHTSGYVSSRICLNNSLHACTRTTSAQRA